MKRRIIALLLVCLCVGTAWAARAENTSMTTEDGVEWISFSVPQGATLCGPGEAALAPTPEGLEGLYHWVDSGGEGNNTRFVCMPNRRVLASASLTEIGAAFTAQELIQVWPRIAGKLAKSALFVNEEATCATTIALDGAEWMHIQTTAVLDGEKMLSVQLEGFANCQNGWMVELWTAEPAQPTYLYDDEAAAQLAEDKDAAKQWLDSVRAPLAKEGAVLPTATLPQQEKTPAAPMPEDGIAPSATLVEYAAPDGRFTLKLPENTIIIPPESAQEKLGSAQEDVPFAARRSLYSHWLSEAEKYRATVFTEPNYGCAMLVVLSESDAPMTLESLEAMEEQITAAVAKDVKGATMVGDRSRITTQEVEYATLVYEGLFSGRPVFLMIFASPEGNTLREINFWEQSAPMGDLWADALLDAMDALHFKTQPTAE